MTPTLSKPDHNFCDIIVVDDDDDDDIDDDIDDDDDDDDVDSHPLPVKPEELPGFDPRSRLRFCFFSSDTFTVTSVKGNK